MARAGESLLNFVDFPRVGRDHPQPLDRLRAPTRR